MKVGCYFFFLLIKEILSQTQELDKIIQEAIKNNPKTEPDLLPVLPKMLTKTGLLCTFPFYFDDKIFFEKCVQIKGGKFICKVNVDPNTLEKEILNKLLNIKDTYFDECLSLDETEKYLNDLVDKNFDFKKKLLIDLYADIKKTISVTRNSKLIILYELAENYCKNKSFDYECLYKWIIKPISKTSTLQSTSNLILATMDKYKTILDQFVKQSINLKFKEREFKYIKKQNLFFTENIEKKTIIDEGGSKSISRELILLDDNKLSTAPRPGTSLQRIGTSMKGFGQNQLTKPMTSSGRPLSGVVRPGSIRGTSSSQNRLQTVSKTQRFGTTRATTSGGRYVRLATASLQSLNSSL